MKRCFDAAAAAVLLVVLSPVMAATALLVRIKLGRPVLYRQVRPGLHEKPFVLYKFRTMADLRDERGNPLPDAERLTPFGRKLRTLSLDELPQLFNVLKGDLSLVGPRPLLMEYLPLYTEDQRQRHLVRPGITGWAQVNGRNAVSWEERFAMDVWYVRNRSMLLDLKILLLTFLRLFKPVGIHQPGRATMDRFTGTGTPG
jgi:Sugar transferases involved in lipopolysaccharide synthesis